MKPRWKILGFGLFLAGLFTAIAPSPAAACSCMPLRFEDAARNACAIFEGVVLAVEPVDGDEEIAATRLRVRMRVVQTWTPGLSEELTLTTAASSASCGFGFEVGKGYLVYADGGHAGAPSASLCGGTKVREHASEDLQRLGMGAVPVSPSQRTVTTLDAPRRGGCATCSVGRAHSTNTTSAMTLLIMTLAWMLARLRRRV